MKKQVVVIHGGDTFDTQDEYINFLKEFKIDSLDYFRKRGWKKDLQSKLGDEYDVILPEMPNKFNAKYEEWKIWFDKLPPLLDDNIILVGHSMGGVFLAKYLAEDRLEKSIRGTFLIAAPFEGDFHLPQDIRLLAEQGGKIFLYHSKDDTQVPFNELTKYQKALPNATARIFDNRGHFNQEEFPELVEDIKGL